jgi:deoxyribodipyrimidine photo-lyase
MQAGVVGLNAIRVYSPAKQLTDWDRDCRFVKRWVPELRDLSPDRILNDSQLPNCVEPIVPFRERSKQMMDLLYAIRKTAEAKAATTEVFLRHGSRKKPPTRRQRKPKPKPKLGSQTASLFDDLNLDE